ncbi:MAG: Anti-sigma factor [Planctomycetota bacterium]|jgi:serine/threonine-protein kinase RsbW
MTKPVPAFRCDLTLRELREGLESAQTTVADALGARGYPEGAMFAVRLAIEEAVVNAFRHGNLSDPKKVVFFRAAIDDARADFEVEDQGPGFDPRLIPDPTDEDNLEIPSGRGVMLIKAYMTEVEYVKPGNKLRMALVKPTSP